MKFAFWTYTNIHVNERKKGRFWLEQKKNAAMLINDEWDKLFNPFRVLLYFDCVTRQTTKIWQEMNIKEDRLFVCVCSCFVNKIHERKQRRCKFRNKKGSSDDGLTQNIFTLNFCKWKGRQYLHSRRRRTRKQQKKRLHFIRKFMSNIKEKVKELFASYMNSGSKYR